MPEITSNESASVYAKASDQFGGWALIAGSVLSIAVVHHHPHIHRRGLTDIIDEFARLTFANGLVHGVLIILIGAFILGFSYLVNLLGSHRPAVRAGLIVYGLGATAMVASALTNGFIIPGFVARHDRRSVPAVQSGQHDGSASKSSVETITSVATDELQTMVQIMGLAVSANQVFTRLGIVAFAIAFLCWSIPMLRFNRSTHVVGIYGIITGCGLILALFSGHLSTNFHGMLIFVIAQGCWTIAVGWLMVTRRIKSNS